MQKIARLLVVGILFLGITLYIAVYLYIATHVYKDNKVKSDAIIVLGAKARLGESDNPCLVARVHQAERLYEQGYGKVLIVSGGEGEAEGMKKLAVEVGAKPEDVLLENKATSTYENLILAREIMKKHNMKSAVIVTEAFHSPRADLVADKIGLTHTLSPAVDGPCWSRWKYFSRFIMREPIAVMAYKLQGKL